MTDQAHGAVWKSDTLTKTYLDGVRAAIPGQAERLDIMLRLIRANGRPVLRFLDLGCGDGILGRVLLCEWPDAHGMFVDFSEAMLNAARALLRDSANQSLLNLDYGDPGWVAHIAGHAPFDVIVSGFSIHHQPDARKREIYTEIHSLLAPGGIFINIEHVKSATPWGERLFEDLFVDRLTEAHAASGKTRAELAREFYNRPDKTANILAPVETQLSWLRELGFEDVDVFSKTFELCLMAGRKGS
jgi:tRNA (cmo5U34)-methyltransferase